MIKKQQLTSRSEPNPRNQQDLLVKTPESRPGIEHEKMGMRGGEVDLVIVVGGRGRREEEKEGEVQSKEGKGGGSDGGGHGNRRRESEINGARRERESRYSRFATPLTQRSPPVYSPCGKHP